MADESLNIGLGLDIGDFSKGMKDAASQLKNFRAPKSEFDKLNKSFRDAITDAKKLAVTHGETSDAFLEAANRAKDLRTQLQGVHEAVEKATGGISQLEGKAVGQRRGFDGLSHSFAQLTREAPAFANSMQTGFMAISNNIPMFVDQIQLMSASGATASSVMTSVGKAIFSWQTAMSLGITALVIFGPKLAEMVFGLEEADEALNKNRKSWEDLNEQINEYISTDLQNSIRRENKEYKETKETLEDRIKTFESLQKVQKQNLELTGESTDKNNYALLIQEEKNRLVEAEKSHIKNINELQKEKVRLEKESKEIAAKPNASDIFTAPETQRIDKFNPLSKFMPSKEHMAQLAEAYSNVKIIAVEKHREMMEEIEAQQQRLGESLRELAVQAGGAVFEALGQSLAGYGEFDKSILRILGDVASSIGTQLMAIGSLMIASGVLVGQGIAALGAGAGLKVLGGFLGGTASKNAPTTQSSSPVQTYNGYSPLFDTSQVFYMDGRVRGQDLIIASNNTRRDNRR